MFVDPAAGYLFIRSAPGVILRFGLDLSDETTVVGGLSAASNPQRALMCGNAQDQRIFYIDGMHVKSAMYDGTFVANVYTDISALGDWSLELPRSA